MPSRQRPQRTISGAYCNRCSRTFINDRALEQHLNASPRHNICPGCDMDYHTEEDMNDCDCMGSEEGSEDYDDEGSAGTLSEDDGIVDYGGLWPPAYGFSSDDDRYYYGHVREYGSGASEDHDHDSDSHAWTSSEYEEGSTVSRSEDPQEEMHRRAALPYCQRCNKEFQSESGLHSHRRMSRFHPFYCGRCRIDFEREHELESHNATAHAPVSFTRMIASTLSPLIASPIVATRTQNPRPPPPPQEPINPRAAMAARIAEATARRATITAADTSSSTIRPPSLSPTTPAASTSKKEPVHSPSDSISSPPAATSPPKFSLTCPLCLENVDGMTTTLCGHVFCKECITAAVQHKPECPVCRAFTHSGSLHAIYLNVS
ncbi:hypothetical protein CPB86DRAFT_786876 [Serendipita vermifera]|nr:hypothetical protein CPB86DRAFT_786876 [Serendipita vermifera]